MSVSDEIKSRLDIVDVVSEYVQLRKSGHSYSGFCPFHSNSRTPAFVVFPDSQTWRCFGACAEGGDVFNFLMKKEGWDFKEALRVLADRAGVILETHTPEQQEKNAAADRLGDLLTAATDYFHHLFMYAPEAAFARRYMQDREITSDTLETFQIGYALDRWDACRTHFQEQGYTHQELLDAGLLTVNEDKGTTYDRFRNRLMFPIRDVSGRVVGFGARTLEKDGIPKYLNSPQTALFNKSNLLFGLDLTKRHIREARQAVIVEGYMDMIRAWQAGYNNVIAQMGTALTPEQLRLLRRFTKRFVLALDSDAAGDKATLRGLEVVLNTLDRDLENAYDPNTRGMVLRKGKLQIDLRAASLPDGDDPDSLIRRNPKVWQSIIEKSEPIITYVLNSVMQGVDLDDPKMKANIANRVMPLIEHLADPIEQSHYKLLLANRLKVDQKSLDLLMAKDVAEDAVKARIIKAKGKVNSADRIKTRLTVNPNNRITQLEANYLAQCLTHPYVILQVNQKLTTLSQPAISIEDFSHAEDQQIVAHLWQNLQGNAVASTDELWDSLEEWLRDRVQFHLNSASTTSDDLTRLPDTLALSVLEWRQEKLKRLGAEMKRLCEEAASQDDPTLRLTYTHQVNKLAQQERSIHRARHAMSAVSRRKTE